MSVFTSFAHYFCLKNGLGSGIVVGDMPIPGQLARFDNHEKWFLITCLGDNLLSNIVICLVISI